MLRWSRWSTRQGAVCEVYVIYGDVSGLVEGPGRLKQDGEILGDSTNCYFTMLPLVSVAA